MFIKVKTSYFTSQFLFVFLSFILIGNSQKVKENESAPDFDIKQQLGVKISATKLAELKGKFVLIDFWATWCKPCVKTMPYLEKVKEQFGDTLVVLSISDESPEEIERYLKNKTINSTIVVDASSKITNKYAVDAIPHSVLIGADGRIKLIGSPLSMTPNAIRSVMSNRVVEVVKPVVAPEKIDEFLGDTPKGIKSSIEVTPFNPQKPSIFREVTKGEYANRRLYFSNMTIKAIYEHLYYMPNRGILKVPSLEKFTDGAEATSLYCVDIIIRKEDVNRKFEVAIKELHQRFSLKSRMEYITLMAKVLEVDNKAYLPTLATYETLETEASTFDELVNKMNNSNTFGMPVVNETKLTERYTIAFNKLPNDPGQLAAVLRSKGIRITEKVQQIPMLILYE